eukprot:2811954-Prymnesium_polylepis.1
MGCVVIGRGGDRLTTLDTGILEMPSAVLSYSIFWKCHVFGSSKLCVPRSAETGGGRAPGMMLGGRMKPVSVRCGSIGWNSGIVLLYGSRTWRAKVGTGGGEHSAWSAGGKRTTEPSARQGPSGTAQNSRDADARARGGSG